MTGNLRSQRLVIVGKLGHFGLGKLCIQLGQEETIRVRFEFLRIWCKRVKKMSHLSPKGVSWQWTITKAFCYLSHEWNHWKIVFEEMKILGCSAVVPSRLPTKRPNRDFHQLHFWNWEKRKNCERSKAQKVLRGIRLIRCFTIADWPLLNLTGVHFQFFPIHDVNGDSVCFELTTSMSLQNWLKGNRWKDRTSVDGIDSINIASAEVEAAPKVATIYVGAVSFQTHLCHGRILPQHEPRWRWSGRPPARLTRSLRLHFSERID